MKQEIGFDTDEEYTICDKKYFQITDLMKTLDITHEEKMVIVCNLIWETVVNPFCDKETGLVDCEKANSELNKIIRDARGGIDTSNDILSINPNYKKK